jgi:hypothetical protein
MVATIVERRPIRRSTRTLPVAKNHGRVTQNATIQRIWHRTNTKTNLNSDADSDHDHIFAVLPEDLVIRQERQRFRQCLRQQHPIERIAMERRQLMQLRRMFAAD